MDSAILPTFCSWVTTYRIKVMGQLLTSMASKSEPKDWLAVSSVHPPVTLAGRTCKEIAARASEALARIIAAEVAREKIAWYAEG